MFPVPGLLYFPGSSVPVPFLSYMFHIFPMENKIYFPELFFKKTAVFWADILFFLKKFKVFSATSLSPDICPRISFKSFSLSANALFIGVPAEGSASRIFQPDKYPSVTLSSSNRFSFLTVCFRGVIGGRTKTAERYSLFLKHFQ